MTCLVSGSNLELSKNRVMRMTCPRCRQRNLMQNLRVNRVTDYEGIDSQRKSEQMNLPAEDAEGQARVAAFVAGLRESGWTDGRNLRVDTRWGGGDADRIRRDAGELVALWCATSHSTRRTGSSGAGGPTHCD